MFVSTHLIWKRITGSTQKGITCASVSYNASMQVKIYFPSYYLSKTKGKTKIIVDNNANPKPMLENMSKGKSFSQ